MTRTGFLAMCCDMTLQGRREGQGDTAPLAVITYHGGNEVTLETDLNGPQILVLLAAVRCEVAHAIGSCSNDTTAHDDA